MRFLFLVLALLWPAAAGATTVTDLAGRSVAIDHPVRRVVLAEANDLLSLALIHPNPASLIVGWAGLYRLDKGTLGDWRAHFPAIDSIVEVGGWSADTFSVEKALSLRPDLVIMTAYQDPKLGGGEFARQFAEAGVPVVFVTPPMAADARAYDIAPRLRLFGQVLDREQQAQDYIAFHEAHLARLQDRLRDVSTRPKVLLENYAGLGECCRAPGRHGWADFIALAGGANLGTVSPSAAGSMLSMEFIIAENPDIYIGAGGSYLENKGLTIGPGYAPEVARETLARLMRRPGFTDLKALRDGRVHGIWTALGSLPQNIVLAEVMATWLHPARFADLDPAATLDEINRRFMAVPLSGRY
jgi:iron complex transport system substrate-binding protein